MNKTPLTASYHPLTTLIIKQPTSKTQKVNHKLISIVYLLFIVLIALFFTCQSVIALSKTHKMRLNRIQLASPTGHYIKALKSPILQVLIAFHRIPHFR